MHPLGRRALSRKGGLGVWEATAIGVGGMVGGGIFAVLGLSVELARGAAPIAFLVAGVVALVTAYSYARLSVAFPSQGGTVAFLDRAFGPGMLAGSLNVLLWISYVVMLALYAYAFGSYASELVPASVPIGRHALVSAALVGLTALNLFGAEVVGDAEDFVVAVKITILVFFVGVGLWGVDPTRLAPTAWAPPLQIVAGGMIIFVAYEGFELIANAAEDVRDPSSTLPRAYYASVGFVLLLYVLVSAVAVGTLSLEQIAGARDYALAEAARPFLGSSGRVLISVAAVLSTASAINATLYGSARLSYVIAKDGELPEVLEKKVWSRPVEGLLITTAVALLLANSVDLSSMSTMGSAGFLVVFAAVNIANVRLAAETGSHAWLSGLGAALCVGALTVLIVQTWTSSPVRLWVLVGMLVIATGVEGAYRGLRGRASSSRT